MNKINYSLLLSILAIAMPIAVYAQSSADLQAQIQSLLQQVQTLQSSITSGQTGTVAQTTTPASVNSQSCPNIGRVLKLGASGTDVSRLQQFLAIDAAVYPEAIVSGYYGALTESAVKRWQTKYNVVSSGTPNTTGFGVVGPRTAAAIALLCSTSTASTSSPVGGYIQVSPISGNAPLTVNVQATVNSTNSCIGAVYTLDWGDNSTPVQIPVSANNCNQVSNTYTHPYQYGGNYLITLSAQGHFTTANVTVYGQSAPTTQTTTQTTQSTVPQQPTTPCPNGTSWRQACPITGSGSCQWVCGAGSSSSNTSGNSVYGPVSITPGTAGMRTVTAQFASGSCPTYSISWGDGSVAQNSSACSSASTGSGTSQSINHTYTSTGQFTITILRGNSPQYTDTSSVVIN